MTDGIGRNIDYLRISVTDKCNLRCKYCMPSEGVPLFSHDEILTLEEIARLVKIFKSLGVKKVRLTGGEPLVRKNITKLISDIKEIGIEEIALTTNGVLYSEMASDLTKAGLKRVNLSLDTLNAKNFETITGKNLFENTKNAINAALKNKMRLKINCVACKEFNENELSEIAALAKDNPIDVRFIELMPIGCAKDFTRIESGEILKKLEDEFGKFVPVGASTGSATGDSVTAVGEPVEPFEVTSGPAKYVQFKNFNGRVGFISPISHKFCSECNRVRLTADGRLKLCLQYETYFDLKTPLRSGKSDNEIKSDIIEALKKKPAEHNFLASLGETTEKTEKRRMVQIGG